MGNLRSEIFIAVRASSPSSELSSFNWCGYLVIDTDFQGIVFLPLKENTSFLILFSGLWAQGIESYDQVYMEVHGEKFVEKN